MKRLSMLLLATFVLPFITTACTNKGAPQPAQGSASPAKEEDKQWRMPNKNYASTRYSSLNAINTDNVKTLKAAWSFSTGVLRGHEGGPLVVGNTMYVHTPFPNIVYALDLTKEGAPVKWKYVPKQDPRVIPVACCDTVNRGLTYADGRLFQNQNGSDDGTMQSWAKLLDEKQITQLYIYVRARADKVLPPGRPDEVGPNGSPWLPPTGWPRQP